MVPCVREMAERFNASVTLLHAFDLVRDYVLAPVFEVTGEFETTAIPYMPSFQELRNERQRKLEEFSRQQFQGVRCVPIIQDGDAAVVIKLVAQSENSDLIVMPTRGLGMFRRLLLGSVTAKVLHDVTCPVLTSAHELNPPSAPNTGFRSIVCAVDINLEAAAVLNAAGFLAQTYGARLCVVHMESASPREAHQPASAESVRQAYERAMSADGPKVPVDAKIRVLDTGVTEGIRRTAMEENADLVVVGRGHERGNVSRIWSHLYTIIRDSPCPVLSV